MKCVVAIAFDISIFFFFANFYNFLIVGPFSGQIKGKFKKWGKNGLKSGRYDPSEEYFKYVKEHTSTYELVKTIFILLYKIWASQCVQ